MPELEKELFPTPVIVSKGVVKSETVNKPLNTKAEPVQKTRTENAPQIKPPTNKEEPPTAGKK